MNAGRPNAVLPGSIAHVVASHRHAQWGLPSGQGLSRHEERTLNQGTPHTRSLGQHHPPIRTPCICPSLFACLDPPPPPRLRANPPSPPNLLTVPSPPLPPLPSRPRAGSEPSSSSRGPGSQLRVCCYCCYLMLARYCCHTPSHLSGIQLLGGGAPLSGNWATGPLPGG